MAKNHNQNQPKQSNPEPVGRRVALVKAVQDAWDVVCRLTNALDDARAEHDDASDALARYDGAVADAASKARMYWPEDKPMPEYAPESAVPCPECRRVILDSGQRAVVQVSRNLGRGVVYYACHACGHGFKLMVK